MKTATTEPRPGRTPTGGTPPDDNQEWAGSLVREAAIEVFTMMRPRPCPFPMVRVGPDRDGGYLVPDDLDGVVACFSPGVSNRKDFEDDLAQRFGIRSHLCDYSSDADRFATPLRDGQTFTKKWLDVDGTPDSVSLEKWVTEFEPDGDLLLQMDIEGAEYRNLLSWSDEILDRFRIIVLEVHYLSRLTDPATTLDVFRPFFRKLSAAFTPVHAHPNNAASALPLLDTGVHIPSTLELTWIRSDRLSSSPQRLIAPMLPHPLDIKYNVLHRPPSFLSDEWVIGDRPRPSTDTMISRLSEWTSSQERTASRAAKKAGDLAPPEAVREIRSMRKRLVDKSRDYGIAVAERDRARHDVAELSRTLKGVRSSVTMRVGAALRTATTSPRGFFRLPVELFRIWRSQRGDEALSGRDG